ncbi:MAG TPA: glycosyltransferase family 2 protein [Chitinophagaceae bacterium]|jgi:cellulose synthase/poly-beta-1,6-N-acetylglucosamine synthase-like glycosyltransferase|nr:glycosyltransferase family 2 protein [Chitinophagaceae bacterium]
MFVVKLLFFAGVLITFYSYIGYGLLLWAWLKGRRWMRRQPVEEETEFLPPVTLIVAAYNEEHFIYEKIKNTEALDYPRDRLQVIFVTDGSTDATPEKVARFPWIRLLHSSDRRGKVAAMHRAVSFVETPYIVFCDANTLLNRESIRHIVRHYRNPQVGGVAGEKKILPSANDTAAGAGEGLYWKYESFLKKLDWQFHTVVGAAGELFSVRTDLYEHPGDNILLDDFVISLRVAQKGYRVAYDAEAYAMETASASMKEEQKRKVRISAGAFQSMVLLKSLLNPFRYGKLSFQYLSHRVLRWTLCPLLLPIVFITNAVLAVTEPSVWYDVFFAGQVLFYGAAAAGWVLSLRNVKISALYAPYYFVFINYSLYLGFARYLKGKQSVLWEKASRLEVAPGK